jgi:hypothetical protein
MTTTSTRRAVLAGAAALPALAAPAAAIAATNTGNQDAELRRLWRLYVDTLDQFSRACDEHLPGRAAYDEEHESIRDDLGWNAWQAAVAGLRIKHGLDRTWPPVDAALTAMAQIVARIQATPAETLFGIGVKISAVAMIGADLGPDKEDYIDAIRSALPDIDRLAGGNFWEIVAAGDGDDVDAADSPIEAADTIDNQAVRS